MVRKMSLIIKSKTFKASRLQALQFKFVMFMLSRQWSISYRLESYLWLHKELDGQPWRALGSERSAKWIIMSYSTVFISSLMCDSLSQLGMAYQHELGLSRPVWLHKEPGIKVCYELKLEAFSRLMNLHAWRLGKVLGPWRCKVHAHPCSGEHGRFCSEELGLELSLRLSKSFPHECDGDHRRRRRCFHANFHSREYRASAGSYHLHQPLSPQPLTPRRAFLQRSTAQQEQANMLRPGKETEEKSL